MSVTCDRSVVFSTNKTDHHDITAMLLKVTINTMKRTTKKLCLMADENCVSVKVLHWIKVPMHCQYLFKLYIQWYHNFYCFITCGIYFIPRKISSLLIASPPSFTNYPAPRGHIFTSTLLIATNLRKKNQYKRCIVKVSEKNISAIFFNKALKFPKCITFWKLRNIFPLSFLHSNL